ncbi:hypothetical protein NOL04_04610 [Streptococcus suis]|uniref:hypothetical protein n=1 Tax=Streptococcus parasuis TaxID=1501662 RepID=UPI002412D2BE|nr:hypothetical protein [Streptococcus parasuis]MDG4477925.1 hypothetical protein [Streptococcus parasuis]MDG4514148.1 hypothetical protein [Streptococcus suis]
MKSIVYNEFLAEFRNITNVIIFVIIAYIISFIQRTPQLFLVLNFLQILGIYSNKELTEKIRVFERLAPINTKKLVLNKYFYLFLKIFVSSLLYLFLLILMNSDINFDSLEDLFIFVVLSVSFGVVIVFKKVVGVNNYSKVKYYGYQLVLIILPTMINQIYKFIDCQISNTVIFMINIFLYSIFVIFFYRLTISYLNRIRGL